MASDLQKSLGAHDRTDVLVAGGGVIGLCTAYYCLARGAEVTVLEKDRIPAGSSAANAGLIVPSHCQPLASPEAVSEALKSFFEPHGTFGIKMPPDAALLSWLIRFLRFCNRRHVTKSMEKISLLMNESRALHEEMAGTGGGCYDYSQKGLLYLYGGKKAFSRGAAHARLIETLGIRSRVLSSRDVRDLDPSIGKEIAGAVMYPDDGRLDPGAFVSWLAERIREGGGKIFEETEVIGLGTRGASMDYLITTRGDFFARDVVFAAGAWTPVLMKMAGLRLPIQGAKGYSVTFDRPEQGMPRYPLLLEEPRIAVTPFKDSLRLAGILDLAGFDTAIDPKRIAHMQKQVKSFLPVPGPMKIREIWRGFRPCAPDGIPVLGRAGGYKNLWAATGHATKGMSLGPVTGKLMSDLLQGRSIGGWEAFLSPSRF